MRQNQQENCRNNSNTVVIPENDDRNEYFPNVARPQFRFISKKVIH